MEEGSPMQRMLDLEMKPAPPPLPKSVNTKQSPSYYFKLYTVLQTNAHFTEPLDYFTLYTIQSSSDNCTLLKILPNTAHYTQSYKLLHNIHHPSDYCTLYTVLQIHAYYT